jgi:Multicopper oxidase
MLVNLAGEDHNFHVHQTRFSVVASTGNGGTALPSTVNGNPVLLDNVPLPHATGDACDGTVGPRIAGTCKPTFVTVSIPFHEVGDFVYHCHILEHEDGGMMARSPSYPIGARDRIRAAAAGRAASAAKPGDKGTRSAGLAWMRVTISFTRPLTGRRLRSDWMAVERERGVSVSSAVMSFEHEGLAFNLLEHAGPSGFQPNGISARTPISPRFDRAAIG